MGINSSPAIAKALDLIESGNIETAYSFIGEALQKDLDNKELAIAVQYCSFWRSRFQDDSSTDSYMKGENLISSWKVFLANHENDQYKFDRLNYAFRKCVYTRALREYTRARDEGDKKLRAEIFRKRGLCYKMLGSYEMALNCLTQANALTPDISSIIAEMADCYELCGEDKIAKVLFREAFFIDPQKIDLNNLDSQMITMLAKKVSDGGVSGKAVNEWIPVYGTLLGVFDVKRELKSREICHLNQEIFAKENELKNKANDPTLLRPRLLNMYFWQIDYMLIKKAGIAKINEVLLKMKILDPDVHRIYTK